MDNYEARGWVDKGRYWAYYGKPENFSPAPPPKEGQPKRIFDEITKAWIVEPTQ